MSASIFKAFNGPSPTTGAQQSVTTGTAIKTLLQIATPSTKGLTILEWGISFDGAAAATPIKVELIDTDVAATVTAHVAAGLPKLNGMPDASLMTLGTGATGYTASAEGSITATRVLDCQFIAPTSQYIIQYPLDQGPVVAASRFLRIRVLAGTAVNAVCYITWQE